MMAFKDFKRFRRRVKIKHYAKIALIFVLFIYFWLKFEDLYYLIAYRAFHVLSYATRPLWDTPLDLNITLLPFYGSGWCLIIT